MASPKVLSSKRGDWQTPRAVIELIEEFNNAPIYLDPCGAPSNPTNADANWFPPKDGLAERWSRDGSLIFVNPPYADIAKWVERISIEASEGAEVILLCAPRTDTSWFRDVWTANVIAFWHGSHQKGCELRQAGLRQHESECICVLGRAVDAVQSHLRSVCPDHFSVGGNDGTTSEEIEHRQDTNNACALRFK